VTELVTGLTDTAAGLATACALLFFLTGRRPSERREGRLVVAGLISLILYEDVVNALDHLGLTRTALFDLAGNYGRILVSILWGVLFLVIVQEVNEQSIRQATERFRSLVETTSDWIWETDARGVYTYASPRIRELLGYEPGEIIGRRAGESLFEVASDTAAPGPDGPVARREGLTGRETVHRHRDGHPVVIETNAIPFFDARGNLQGWRGVDRDVTRRKEDEEEIHRARLELERQNVELRRLDAIKNGLVRDVSHELKTPLAKFSMQLEVLRHRLRESVPVAGVEPILEEMEASIHRQDKAIRNILNLSRLESGGRRWVMEPVEVAELVGEVAGDFRGEFESRGVDLALDLEPVTIRSDREMLWHVFSNVIGNAIKFRAAGRPATVLVRVRPDGGRALATVRDNGIGLSPEQKERVFERFYKAVASIEGTGVGLTIARMIIEGVGGTIDIDSPGPDGWATVTVRL
jgi:PAS domain S-box-containing protein